MQVTLVQSEIEQALREFINSQINIKDGMEIVIVLKATRGDEGTTAIIDIVKPEPVADAVKGTAIVSEPKARTVTAAKNEMVKDTPAKQPAVEKAVPVVKEEPAQKATPVVEEELEEQLPDEQTNAAEAGSTGGGQIGGAADDPAPERPVSKAASLFSGLQKPKNA